MSEEKPEVSIGNSHEEGAAIPASPATDRVNPAHAELTEEAIQRIVDARLNVAMKAAEEKAAVQQKRKATIDRLVEERPLLKKCDLGEFITGNTDAELKASADRLSDRVRRMLPDFGGATRDGGISMSTYLQQQMDAERERRPG